MIGNDVVDLDDVEALEVHPRFDARVFTEAELAAVRASGEPHRLRWLLWAAKESAFKLVKRSRPGVPFVPRRFEARTMPLRIRFEEQVLDVHAELAARFVHCIATDARQTPTLAGVARIDAGADAGVAARRLAVRSIAPLLGTAADELDVGREGRLPVLLRSGIAVAGWLSLSHHGRHVAFAWKSAGSADLDASRFEVGEKALAVLGRDHDRACVGVLDAQALERQGRAR